MLRVVCGKVLFMCLLILCNVQSKKKEAAACSSAEFSVCDKGQCVSQFLFWHTALLPLLSQSSLRPLFGENLLSIWLKHKMPVMVIKTQ